MSNHVKNRISQLEAELVSAKADLTSAEQNSEHAKARDLCIQITEINARINELKMIPENKKRGIISISAI